MGEEVILSRVIVNSEFEQIRLTVNEFRDVQYLHLRNYYLDFSEEWLPTGRGIAIPITIDNIARLFNALVDMLAKSDVLHIILDNSSTEVQELIHATLSERLNGKSE